ncbi:MAG: TIGR04283 family arsenosugar biosynthesis glycosyltransferase [Ardenticatenaceae bacterium]|nr:TIGR04283 family arsenosugar biosynthesis glycosyltransferase [Ardenticatenaceae bacterium]
MLRHLGADVVLISVITPALNEEEMLPLRAAEVAAQTPPWEWVVADGGSRDATVAAARAHGAIVVVAPRGRGAQLNAGAAAAQGEVLLFLHADTALPPGSLDAVRTAATDPALVGGNFRLRFEGRDVASRLFTAYYRAQQQWLNVYYGDSAIFVRREVFAALSGFRNDPIMEDYDFVRRLEQLGPTACLPLTVTTSARRYRGRVVRTIATWASILLLYRLGVPPARLARLYAPPGEGGDG